MNKVCVINSSTVNAENYGAISVKELLNEAVSENMSVATINLNGTNRKNVNTASDMFYFVIKGRGVFNIEGKEYPVKEGFLICIPKNTPYFDSGEMLLLSFSSPRFDPSNVKFLD